MLFTFWNCDLAIGQLKSPLLAVLWITNGDCATSTWETLPGRSGWALQYVQFEVFNQVRPSELLCA